MKSKISITLDSTVLDSVDLAVDGLNLMNRSQAIEHLLKKSIEENKIAVILCGGNAQKTEDGDYKICAPFLGGTVIEYNLNILRKKGFRKIYIVGNKGPLIELFKKIGNGSSYGISIEYIENGPNPKGTMDSLSNVRKISQAFLTAFGDEILTENIISALWDAHFSYKGLATIHVQASTDCVENAGVVTIEGHQVKKFTQKPGKRISLIHFSGVFVAEPEFLNCQGNSIEWDVFPKLAEKGLLQCYVSSEVMHHFHTQKELNKIGKEISASKALAAKAEN